MKKLLSVMLSLLMVLSVFSFSAFAADTCNHSNLMGGVTEKEPTCVTTGVKKVWCGTCQTYVYLVIPTVGHTWVWTVTKQPTLNSTGLKNGICSVCKKTQNGVVMPKLECSVHSADSWEKSVQWTVIAEPTCTSTGKKQARCTGCNKNITREIPKKEHDAVVFSGKAATCEEYGKTDAIYCFSCRTYLVAHDPIPLTGHNMVLRHGMYDVDPTCTEKGSGTMICLNDGCDHTEQIEVKTIPHEDYNNDLFCDMCEARICKCICHKDNFIARFVRKLNTLLNKLLNDGEMIFSCCECMEPLAL